MRHATHLHRILLVAILAVTARAQTPTLQQQYDKAQALQSNGDMEQAAFAYQLFLASAIQELADGREKIGDHELAAARFEEALALHPSDAALLAHTAQAESNANHVARAKELALKLPPKEAATHALMGSILTRSGENEAAVKEYEAAVALDPSLENGFALARAYLMKKDEAAAIRIFTEIQASAPNTAVLHMEIGRIYGQSGYPDQAIVEFKKALAKDNALPGLHYSLGASYLLSMGEIDFPQATAEFHKELALHPNDFLSHSQLGYVALSQHNYPEAEKELRRATEINPRDPDTLLSLGQLYVDTNHPQQAEPVLRKAIALTTDPSRNHYQVQRAHYLLGRVLLQTGRTGEAKAEMQTSTDLLKLSTLQNQGRTQAEIAAATNPSLNTKAESNALPEADPKLLQQVEELEKRLSPAIADSYNNLGATAARDKNYRAAVDDFEHAAAWNPALDGLDYNLGRAAYSANNYKVAVAPLGRYLAQHPENEWFRAASGVSLFMTGSYSAAAETLRPIESTLQTRQLASIYAAALIESGDTQQGIARLEKLEAAEPSRPEFHRMLGKAFQRTGNKDRAEQEFREAIRLDPTDTASRQLLAQLEQTKPTASPSAPK